MCYTRGVTPTLGSKYDCNPVKMFVPILVQAPVFISFYFAISRMSEGLPSFKTGGDFWFTDLSMADPTYAMPVLSAATFLLSIELGGAAGAMGGGPEGAENDPQQMYMKWFMRGLGVAMVPLTASFPAGVFVYWITTNMFSFGQMMVLKVPLIKKLAAIPEIPKAPVTAAAKPTILGQREIEKKFGAAPQLHGINPKVRGWRGRDGIGHDTSSPLEVYTSLCWGNFGLPEARPRAQQNTYFTFFSLFGSVRYFLHPFGLKRERERVKQTGGENVSISQDMPRLPTAHT